MSAATPNHGSPARIYDQLFVPALFGPWGDALCDEADVRPGHAVLDVACGTGALATAASRRIGGRGRVVGLDANPEMLAVAREKADAVTWHEGRAEDLPFADATFDRVLSQFGLMFFDDPAQALRHMTRVLRPDGRLTVAVCDAIDHSPGYSVFTELLHRLFGGEVADGFRAPFRLGDRDRLLGIAREADLESVHVRRRDGSVRFASAAAMVSAERACAWTLGGILDEEQFHRLIAASEESLAPFTRDDGTLEFVMPALILEASPIPTATGPRPTEDPPTPPSGSAP